MEPPKRARIWLPSMTEVDQSIRPAAFSPRNSSRCSRSHTPADCHSAKRRCAVAGEQPISVGRCRQAMPVNRTKTIALKHTRSSTRGRPPRGSGGCSGSNGEIACHSSSRTCQVDLATRTPPRPGLCHPTKFARQASNPPMGGIETASYAPIERYDIEVWCGPPWAETERRRTRMDGVTTRTSDRSRRGRT